MAALRSQTVWNIPKYEICRHCDISRGGGASLRGVKAMLLGNGGGASGGWSDAEDAETRPVVRNCGPLTTDGAVTQIG